MKDERAGQSLETTALVHEAYVRLVQVKDVDRRHRAQFFTIAAQMMRRILVDRARARGSRKRGGGADKVGIDEVALVSPQSEHSLVALEDALNFRGVPSFAGDALHGTGVFETLRGISELVLRRLSAATPAGSR